MAHVGLAAILLDLELGLLAVELILTVFPGEQPEHGQDHAHQDH